VVPTAAPDVVTRPRSLRMLMLMLMEVLRVAVPERRANLNPRTDEIEHGGDCRIQRDGRGGGQERRRGFAGRKDKLLG
jgi:hypothetical protein